MDGISMVRMGNQNIIVSIFRQFIEDSLESEFFGCLHETNFRWLWNSHSRLSCSFTESFNEFAIKVLRYIQ